MAARLRDGVPKKYSDDVQGAQGFIIMEIESMVYKRRTETYFG